MVTKGRRIHTPPYRQSGHFSISPGGPAALISHEHGHDFVRHEHALAGQPEPRLLAPQEAGLQERLEATAESLPDVHAVAPAHARNIDAGREAQPREQRLLEPLAGGHLAPIGPERGVRPDAL